jgi:hypothetical protein
MISKGTGLHSRRNTSRSSRSQFLARHAQTVTLRTRTRPPLAGPTRVHRGSTALIARGVRRLRVRRDRRRQTRAQRHRLDVVQLPTPRITMRQRVVDRLTADDTRPTLRRTHDAERIPQHPVRVPLQPFNLPALSPVGIRGWANSRGTSAASARSSIRVTFSRQSGSWWRTWNIHVASANGFEPEPQNLVRQYH